MRKVEQKQVDVDKNKILDRLLQNKSSKQELGAPISLDDLHEDSNKLNRNISWLIDEMIALRMTRDVKFDTLRMTSDAKLNKMMLV